MSDNHKTLYIANDHAGHEAKRGLLAYLESLNIKLVDLGCHSSDRVDYPDFAKLLASRIQTDKDHDLESVGILICGSGIGISMAANRYKGIRAALCRSPEESKLSKQHNNANVLCLDGRVASLKQREIIIQNWLEASFEGGRHQGRIDKFSNLGEKA